MLMRRPISFLTGLVALLGLVTLAFAQDAESELSGLASWDVPARACRAQTLQGFRKERLGCRSVPGYRPEVRPRPQARTGGCSCADPSLSSPGSWPSSALSPWRSRRTRKANCPVWHHGMSRGEPAERKRFRAFARNVWGAAAFRVTGLR